MYVLYYASMLRCWHIVWILVMTNHPCLGVGCHNEKAMRWLQGVVAQVAELWCGGGDVWPAQRRQFHRAL
jgi:hypothetical protein